MSLFERKSYPLPKALPDVSVRVLKATFLVRGELPAIGAVVKVPPDVAESLAAVGKAERVS